MAKKANKNIRISDNQLQLISEELAKVEFQDAYASIMLNPYVRWAKFTLTDDLPNGNRERVPASEFDNLLISGVHMPIKMAEGRIEDGHEDATPIGVIAHLQKVVEDGVNKIIGLAALWLNERPGDVSYLKSKLDDGDDVNLSWEMGAKDRVLAEDGIYDWFGVSLKAATVVNRPAYLGRTQITAIAAKKKSADKWSDEYIKNLPDSSFLYIERGGEKDSEGRTEQRLRHFPVKDDKGLFDESRLKEVLVEAGQSNIPTPVLKSLKRTVATLLEKIEAGASLEEISELDITAPLENNNTEEHTVELEQLKQRVLELEGLLANAQSALQEKETALATASASLESLTGEKDGMASELEELRKFKKDIDDEIAKTEKLESIKTKFAEASLVRDEKYFTDNSEKLLAYSDEQLEFMIQELAAFSKTDAEASIKGKKMPNLNGTSGTISTHDIVVALKERKSK